MNGSVARWRTIRPWDPKPTYDAQSTSSKMFPDDLSAAQLERPYLAVGGKSAFREGSSESGHPRRYPYHREKRHELVDPSLPAWIIAGTDLRLRNFRRLPFLKCFHQ
jgi:hypothetical protein